MQALGTSEFFAERVRIQRIGGEETHFPQHPQWFEMIFPTVPKLAPSIEPIEVKGFMTTYPAMDCLLLLFTPSFPV